MSDHALHDTASPLAADLERILGPGRVLVAEADRRFYSQDIAGPRAHVAACVAQPTTVVQLAATVAAAAAAGHAIVPRGGGSSYTGGYVPPRDDSVLVDTCGLDRVTEINTADMYVTVEAGCTWQALLAALEPHGVRTPFWGPLSGATATVGGSLSQNSILWGSARYGVSAETVLGLDVVLADGSLLRTGSAAVATARPFFRYYGAGSHRAVPRRRGRARRQGARHAPADSPPGLGRDCLLRFRLARTDGGCDDRRRS